MIGAFSWFMLVKCFQTHAAYNLMKTKLFHTDSFTSTAFKLNASLKRKLEEKKSETFSVLSFAGAKKTSFVCLFFVPEILREHHKLMGTAGN